MADAILVINAGSSSIKFSVYLVGDGDVALHVQGQVEGLYTAPRFTAKNAAGAVVSERFWGDGVTLGHDGAIDQLAAFLRQWASGLRLVGVGHRVAHGGPEHAGPVRLDREVLAGLEKLIPLAPLHQPHNLTPIRILMERRSDVAQVACFDTSFHRTNPPVAQLYALPQALTDAGVGQWRPGEARGLLS